MGHSVRSSVPVELEIRAEFYSCSMQISGAAPQGGQGGRLPPLRISKREKFENMGYFHASKVLRLAFLLRKYMLSKGFYHDFSTKKASASGGFAP